MTQKEDNKTKRNNLLLYEQGETSTTKQVEDSVRGRIGNALSGALAYKRDSSLFDEEEIQNRDKELQELLALKETDSCLSIDRKDKPVALSTIQTRVLFALSSAIDIEDESVQRKIASPFKGGETITRSLDISALSSLIFGSNKFDYRKKVIEELYNLSSIRQVQIIGKDKNRIKFTAPFIHIGETIEDLNPDRVKGIDFVNVIYGGAFFYELDKRFSIITSRVFEVWRKKPYQTEIFKILLSSILSVYWHFKKAADEAEARIKKELNKTKKVSIDEYAERIRQARKEALSYELNVSNIKGRVTRDYDSKKQYRNAFWKDLEKAVEGLKEIDLLTGYSVLKRRGAKGQDKVIFYISETYNYSEKPTNLITDSSPDDSEISPF